MDLSTILTWVWSALNSAMGITFIATIVLYFLSRLYSAKPLWQQYEGVIISGIKFAEKNIPDDTPNKGLAKLDEALRYAIKVYEQTTQKRASRKVQAELENGIGIIHAKLASDDALPLPNITKSSNLPEFSEHEFDSAKSARWNNISQ